MIVVDTSVFLDELFKFDQKSHEKAKNLLQACTGRGILIVEPEILDKFIEPVQQFKMVRKRKANRALNPQKGKIFSVEINYGTASMGL